MKKSIKFCFVCIIVVLLSVVSLLLYGCGEIDIQTDVPTGEELEKFINDEKDLSVLFDDDKESNSQEDSIQDTPNEDSNISVVTISDDDENGQESEDSKNSIDGGTYENDTENIRDDLVPPPVVKEKEPAVSESKNIETSETSDVQIFDSDKNQTDSETSKTTTYVLNKNSKKFHYSNCSSVSDMSEKNKAFDNNRDSIIAKGYKPCKRCNP